MRKMSPAYVWPQVVSMHWRELGGSITLQIKTNFILNAFVLSNGRIIATLQESKN